MTAAPANGTLLTGDGRLISRNPATGAEVGSVTATDAAAVAEAVGRARAAAATWAGLDFDQRSTALSRFAGAICRGTEELAELVRAETGKPIPEAVIEIVAAVEHLSWAARNARRVLRCRRAPRGLLTPEFSARIEYRPLGVVAVIGPWNYPVFTVLGCVGSAMAAGNTVVFKPSEYTPLTGQWLADTFTKICQDEPALRGEPVLQVVHGLGDTGAALCTSGADLVAFTGSTATGKAVMAACAQSLTPVVLECGGKDAMVVAADADVDAAAEACVWAGLSNAGQTCVGIERVYVLEQVAEQFLTCLVDRARRLKVGSGPGADIGPITAPDQLPVIRRHIEDALSRGATALLGGAEAVRPPYVHPTILVDVPPDAPAMTEETFGPTIAVTRVRTVDQAIAMANRGGYALGGAVFARSGAMAMARRMRGGMISVNSALSFVGVPSLPFGGSGLSGFGRVHGAEGLRAFSSPKAIARRRFRSPLPAMTFDRSQRDIERIIRIARLVHGRR